MVAVNYLWNPINDNIVREFDDSGNTIAEYTTEPDLYGNEVSQYRNGQTSYLYFDAQGNTMELTNDTGTATDAIRYSAFGTVTQRSGGTEIPFQYNGQASYYREVTGFSSVRHRQLSSDHGRWISIDPVGGGDKNPYCYVANAPLTWSDPSGMQERRAPFDTRRLPPIGNITDPSEIDDWVDLGFCRFALRNQSEVFHLTRDLRLTHVVNAGLIPCKVHWLVEVGGCLVAIDLPGIRPCNDYITITFPKGMTITTICKCFYRIVDDPAGEIWGIPGDFRVFVRCRKKITEFSPFEGSGDILRVVKRRCGRCESILDKPRRGMPVVFV